MVKQVEGWEWHSSWTDSEIIAVSEDKNKLVRKAAELMPLGMLKTTKDVDVFVWEERIKPEKDDDIDTDEWYEIKKVDVL